jgi:hypothetical protein
MSCRLLRLPWQDRQRRRAGGLRGRQLCPQLRKLAVSFLGGVALPAAAYFAELYRKHSLAAVRRNAKTMRPSLGGHTRRLAPTEAGILIGTVKGAAK